MFISEQIQVELDQDNRLPVGFVWRGHSLIIKRIITEWQDWGFASGVFKADWRQRRHRNYFRVECDDDETYEIYFDRKTPDESAWFLYRIVGNADNK